MDGKFMKIKQIVIPTLTLLLIASQLTGCASTTQKEMLDMINNQEAITIEIAEPINQEQGTESELNWVELATLQTYPEFREEFDDILNITAHGTNGKNGIIYVAPDGTHTNNSTLHYAFQNQKFIDNVWNNTETTTQIINAIKSNYIDVETDQHAILASINAYFNIFADTEEGYFNANQTLTRAEFYGGAYRAQNPVAELEQDIEFEMAVDAVGENPDTIFASQMQDKIYLGIESGSLDAVNFNSTITRAEAIYTLVTTYYADEYNTITGKEDCYSDCKNGGNIAKDLKFIEKDKATGETTYKKYWQSYELSYALQYPNKGLPTNLYKAMVVAYNHNLIPTNTESNWNDGLTKGDALNLIINIYEDLGTTTNADRGASTGEVIENNQTSEADSTVSNGELTAEDPYLAFSSKNVTYNGDYTYTFTDDFISAVMEMPQYQKYSTYQIKYMLNLLGMFIKDFEENETKEVYYYLNQWSADDIEVMVGGAGEEENIAQEKPAPEVDQYDITALNTTMYSKGDVNVRKGPSTDYEKIGALTLNQEVKITGQSKSTGWYRIEFNGGEGYVSQNYLSNSKITTPAPSTGGNNGGNTTTPPERGSKEELGNAIEIPWGNPDWGGSHITEGGFITT